MNPVGEIDIRLLEKGDESLLDALLHLYVKVFGEPALPDDTAYLTRLLDNTNVLFSAAFQSETLVGGATSYLLPSVYGAYSELYIYDMAVLPEFQRHGIGSKLLEYLKGYCSSAGITEMYVQADAPDTEARNFYQKNGGTELDVYQYSFKI